MAGLFALQIAGLLVGAWNFRDALNPDGVAYLQIASHYTHGQTGLAISGHWGPLLSWLMAPLLMAGLPPLVTARLVMALSGVVFIGMPAHLLQGKTWEIIPMGHVDHGRAFRAVVGGMDLA